MRKIVRAWLVASALAAAAPGCTKGDGSNPVPFPHPTTPSPTDPRDSGADPNTPPPDPAAIDLAGVPLAGPPHFTYVRSFQTTEPVQIAVNPRTTPQIIDRTCDIYVVEARSDDAWASDPSLTDVRGASQAHTFGGTTLGDDIVQIAAPNALPAAADRRVGVGYDVVLDCDRDGALSPGDLRDGGGPEAGMYVLPDLTLPGPHEVATIAHTAAPWLDQILWYPADIADLGALPLVIVAHGFGHELTYYDHLGEHLASHGYVVASIRNDVGSGAAAGTESAAQTLLSNTDHLLAEQATIAGGALEGHIDADHIAWIGHSTGGECVVRAYARLVDGDWSSAHFSADAIALVSSMAPVAFLPRRQSDPHGANYHLLTGAADRDTANYPERGYTQNLALYERATGNRHLTWIHGAGHGDLHNGPQNWLDRPEPAAPDLIGPEGAHPVVLATHLALAERYLRDNPATIDFFERAPFRPAGIPDDVAFSTEHRPAIGEGVFVVDDFQTGAGIDASSSGGAVSWDADHAEEIAMVDHDWSFAWTGGQPSNGMTRTLDPDDDARCLVFDWAPGDDRFVEFALIATERDLTDDRYLAFRAAQGTRHPHTDALDGPLSFSIALRDAHGQTSAIDFGRYATIPRPYRRPGSGAGAGWANEFATVQIPIADFAALGAIDLGNIEAIRLSLGAPHGSPQGRVAFDDLILVR